MSLNDPATFSDCTFCDGQLDSTETHCSFCGKFNHHLQDCSSCIECGDEFGIFVGETQDRCRKCRGGCQCMDCERHMKNAIELQNEVSKK